MSDSWMGSLAEQSKYNPEEGAFQRGIRDTPWFSEFTQHYGGEPNLQDPNYDYRAAWKAGARPEVRDPEDQLLHWPSQFKGENHPNRFVHGVDTRAGGVPGAIAAQDAYDVPSEQSTGVGWANRAAERLYARPEYDPTVVATTASPLVNITEGDIGRATEAAMAVSGGGMTTKGIKAYHSSPHDFERFDLSKIGSGEGAQVYGHGLYFAENPAVSGQGGQYWNQFMRRFKGEEEAAARRLQMAGFDREAAARLTQEAKDRYVTEPSKYLDQATIAQRQAALQRQHDLLTSGQPVGPRTYEVNINADPAHMLDWDKPLREQGRVGEAFRDVVPKPGWWSRQMGDIKDIRHGIATDPGRFGGDAYNSLARMLDKPNASAALREAGIPGIRYLDQGSRGAGTGSSNYVVFDPNIVDIMKKYGIAGAAPAGMGALAAQDRYEEN